MSSGVVVAVRVTPRASRDAVEGVDESGAVRVRVTAAPAEGAANKAVIKLMAGELGVPKSVLTLVSGATSRQKRVLIEGLSAASVLERWPGASARER